MLFTTSFSNQQIWLSSQDGLMSVDQIDSLMFPITPTLLPSTQSSSTSKQNLLLVKKEEKISKQERNKMAVKAWREKQKMKFQKMEAEIQQLYEENQQLKQILFNISN